MRPLFRSAVLLAALAAVAALLTAQTAHQKSVLGTVTAFQPDSLEFAIQPDEGGVLLLKVGPETDVVSIPPGETNLQKAKPAKVTDLALGDRIMVTFVDGLDEARRIILISAGDIAKRNEAERQDWQRRGISGVVAAVNAEEITLEQRSPTGTKTATLVVTGKTKVRRYAPDSVKFTDAQPSALGEISVGDQVQARGSHGDDASKVKAEEIVFGTFLTKVGAITAVNAEAREIRMQDLAAGKPLTVKLTAASQIKKLPDMREMFVSMMKGGRGEHDPTKAPEGFDIKRTLEQLPAGTIDDLKVGATLIVTSTRGASREQLTAIMLVANADGLIQMAQMQAGANGEKSVSAIDAISRLHGGMLTGPGGLSLPAILQ